MGVVFAFGEPAQGLEGWRLTHSQAQAALVVALRRGGREDVRFTRYADVALLAAALKDQALAGALVEIYLSPLDDLDNRGPLLRRTLRAYLEAERNASSAAAALGVARRTVENRLSTIEEAPRALAAPLPRRARSRAGAAGHRRAVRRSRSSCRKRSHVGDIWADGRAMCAIRRAAFAHVGMAPVAEGAVLIVRL